MQRFNGSNGLTLEEVERRWNRWRRGRGRGRVPNELWRLAADMAAKYGVERVATRLKIDADRLREHLPQRQAAAAGEAERLQPLSFVEIPSIAASSGGEWTVELQEESGRKLRVSCQGSSAAQAIEVAQSLWRMPL